MADWRSFFSRHKSDKLLKAAAVLLGGGIVMLSLGDVSGLKEPNPPRAPAEGNVPYKELYERELVRMLNRTKGISDAAVVVTLASSEKQITEKNRSTSMDQSMQEQVAVVRTGNDEAPVVTATEAPAIQGVLVVAAGVEQPAVKKAVVEAVSRTLHVPVHRIAILPGKKGGH